MKRSKNGHIARFDLVRFVDGDMSASERDAALLHLELCMPCAQALGEATRSLAGLSAVVLPIDSVDLPHDSSKARLAANLLKISELPPPKGAWFHDLFHSSSYASYALVLLMTAGLIAGLTVQRTHHVREEAILLPNKILTPGAVRSIALPELCQAADEDDLDPVVSVPTQKVVFREYGISADESKANFQMDYLINPQLGGVDDIRNLWPQPYSPEWNARAKDSLERHLHRMVCEHKIELADAQREIAENWIDAYKKYFHTSKPI